MDKPPPSDELLHATNIALHDVANYLSLISLKSRLMQLDTSMGDSSRTRTAGIIRLVDQCADIINGLKMFRKGEAGHNDIIEIDRFLRRHERTLQFSAGLGTRLKFELACPKATVCIAESDLLTALINIIFNARKSFARDGEIIIRTIYLSSGTSERGQIELSVTDNGIGMDDAQVAACTVAGHSTRGSHGLGMNSVIKTAETAHFQLRVTSQLGVGTTISYVMPVNSEPVTDQHSLSSDHMDAHHDLFRIAVVDADGSMADRIGTALNDPDCAVTLFASADDFLNSADSGQHDIVICSMELCNEHGTRLVDVIHNSHQSIQIMVTSDVVPDVSAVDKNWIFIQKPIDLARLSKLVATIKIIRRSLR